MHDNGAYVNLRPVERQAIFFALSTCERHWQTQAMDAKSASVSWSLPGWYDDLRQLYQRSDPSNAR